MRNELIRFRRLLPLSCLALFGSSAGAQVFVPNTSDIPVGPPGNNSQSENVDFGDVDNDGDWDAVFADGGDFGNDQNRIWINQGPGAALGSFTDATIARFPAVNDQSRDIEFVDFDSDGDLDLYSVNVSSLTNQGSRWWRNVGAGFYVDETTTRWVGLGGAGSSINPSQILAGGGFIDWSGDGDFADLDNDGDMDLFHSSYGAVFGGQVPSRVFLNDGAGFFSEFNPSGFQLPGQNISNGDPGVWCEGVQMGATLNSSGDFCDIASAADDIDLGDVDGDFDLDVLHGSQNDAPRLFQNRLEENGGALGFRDVTGSSFVNGYATGTGHYEQEMGDMDGDGDLDILGVNWNSSFSFNDVTLRNDGSGFFTDVTVLAGSGADDEEGDLFDYDNDGDLDIFIANFSGTDRLYRNNNNGGTGFSYTLVSFTSSPTTAISRDADACDVDGDGDYDIFTADSSNVGNEYWENTSQVPDTHAPYIPNVEQAPDRFPGPTPTVIRAHVYDNAPYYITWYNATTLNYSVGLGPVQSVPMTSSGGQVFRGEIPGNLLGAITYFVRSEDEYGNTATSSAFGYLGTNGGPVGLSFCFGDGTGIACPCGNFGASGEGCANSSGSGGLLSGMGSASASAGDLILSGAGLTPNTPGVYFEGAGLVGGAFGIPFGDGLRCAGGFLTRIQPRIANAAGDSSTTVNIPLKTGASGGDTLFYQLMYRDPNASPCGTDFNVTNALQISWLP